VNRYILIILTVFAGLYSLKAAARVKGLVFDREENKPLAGVYVYVEGTYKGVRTDKYGFFDIKVKEVPATLIVSKIDKQYRTKKIYLTTDDEQNLVIKMEKKSEAPLLDDDSFLLVLSDKGNDSNLLILPAFFYSEETNFGFGATVGCLYGKGEKKSSLMTSCIYTLKNQLKISILPKYYTTDGKYRLSGRLSAKKYPTNFYGIGSDSREEDGERFTPLGGSISLNGQKYLTSSFSIGFLGKLAYSELDKIETYGLLDTLDIPGEDKYFISGSGVTFCLDTRDDNFNTTSGFYGELSSLFYNKAFGSDYNFNSTVLDLRKFVRFSSRNSFAFRLLNEMNWGEIPFRSLPRLGGSGLLRGYGNNRFCDKVLSAFQFEYRVKIWDRIGGVLFSSIAQVADKVADLDVDNMKLIYGGGLRYQLNNGINFRLDYGISAEKDERGLYFTIGEAF